MIDLFKANAYDVIKYKIKELRDAAFVAMKMLKSMNELDKNKKALLQKLIDASIFEGKDILENDFVLLESIFTSLPPEEEFKLAILDAKGMQIENSNSDNDSHHSIDALSAEEVVSDADSEVESKEESSENTDSQEELVDTDEESSVTTDIPKENMDTDYDKEDLVSNSD